MSKRESLSRLGRAILRLEHLELTRCHHPNQLLTDEDAKRLADRSQQRAATVHCPDCGQTTVVYNMID